MRPLAVKPIILLLTTALAVACQGGGQPSQSASPSSPTPSIAWPAGETLAVYDGPSTDSAGHTVYVVGLHTGPGGTSASVLAKASASRRTGLPAPACPVASGCGGPIDPPYVSTTKDAVYMLDGDTTVERLGPGGSRTRVATVPGDKTSRVAFAISPDDARIAFGVIDYSSQAGGSSVYVEKLGGGSRVKVFTSTAVAYWPIGWHAGKIVLASGRAYGGTLLNPYSASSYALVDTVAGATPLPLGRGDCTPSGTLVAAGTACIKNVGLPCMEDLVANAESTPYYNSCLHRVDWSGAETTFLVPSTPYTRSFMVLYAALSVDGKQILTDQLGKLFAPVSPTHGGDYGLGSYKVTVPQFPSMGWIDGQHFSFSYVYPDGVTRARILVDSGMLNVAFEGVSDVAPGVPGSPVTGALVGTVPAAM